MYRLVKDDYKHDQNLFHTASTHEMMSLCLFMIDPNGDRDQREIIHHIESAMDLYAAAAEEDPLMKGLDKHRPTVATIATRCETCTISLHVNNRYISFNSTVAMTLNPSLFFKHR